RQTPDALQTARFGSFEVKRDDLVFADDDGCVFVGASQVEELLRLAASIATTENRQAEKITHGERLSTQLQFSKYLTRRETEPGFTFRQHLREIGGAIEE